MIYQKNKTRIIKTSLLAIAGATLFVGCSNGSSSSNEKSNDDIQTSQLINEKKAKLEVVGDIPQIKSKINRDVVETSIFIQNTGGEVAKITNIQSLADESISLVFPSTTIDPTASNLFVGGRPIQTLGPKSLSKESEIQEQTQQSCTVDISLKPGESCQITTAFKPSKVGNTSQQILVNYTNIQGNTSSTKEINVDYLGIGDANLVIEAGSQLDIALGVLGDPVIPQIRNVIIKNEGEEVAKEINILPIEHPAFSIEQESNTCSGDLNKGESCSFDIKYSPSSEMSGNLPIEVSYLDNFTAENLTQKGSLSYLATGSISLTVTPNDSFPLIASVSKPGTAPQITRKTITVKNEGTKKASSLNITSNNPSHFLITNNNCSVQGLDVGQECTFDATFSPLNGLLGSNNSKSGEVEYSIKYENPNTAIDASTSDVSTSNLFVGGRPIQTLGPKSLSNQNSEQAKKIKLNYVALSDKILNLSNHFVSDNISLDLSSQSCGDFPKIYTNGKHNIPINFKLVATDKDTSKAIHILPDSINKSAKLLLKQGGSMTDFPSTRILNSPNQYSRCESGDLLTENNIYISMIPSNHNTLGAKLDYIDKTGEIKVVKTTNNEELRLNLQQTINYPNGDIFNLNQSTVGLGNVSAATHSAIKISPDINKYPSMTNYVVTTASLNDYTYGGYDISSGEKQINFNTANYQSAELLVKASYPYSTGRMVDKSYLISIKHKPVNLTSVAFDSYNSTPWTLSLSDYGTNDLALISRSMSWGGTRGYIYFKLGLKGFDKFGNEFHYITSSNDNGKYL